MLRWVLEAGFSESYDHLVDDARLWLEGRPDEISMVVLVNFVETPRYHCPVSPDQDPEELGIPLDATKVDAANVILEGEYGPATYKGFTVGGTYV